MAKYWIKKDGKDVQVGAGTFWRAFAVGLLLLVVNLPRYVLREVVFHFDLALRRACNALGQKGLIEVGGVLLQVRYPRSRVEWKPEGLQPEEIAALRRHIAITYQDKPHFDVYRQVLVE